MTMQRVRCSWANWPGAPGFTNFYTTQSLTSLAPFVTFFDAVKAQIPNNLTITVPGSGDLVAEATGQIQGVWTATGGGTVTGTGAAAYAGPTGWVAEWLTGGIVAGRRVLGKTFMVPAVSTAFENNGSIATAQLAIFVAAAAALQSALNNVLEVWSRPFDPDPDRVPPDERPARAGTAWPVIGSRVPDMAVVMKSRRT